MASAVPGRMIDAGRHGSRSALVRIHRFHGLENGRGPELNRFASDHGSMVHGAIAMLAVIRVAATVRCGHFTAGVVASIAEIGGEIAHEQAQRHQRGEAKQKRIAVQGHPREQQIP